MSHSVALARPAERFFDDADADLQDRLIDCFERLAHDPRTYPGIKALQGQLRGRYRVRVGQLRVVFEIDDQQSLVIVTAIAPRDSAYD